MRAGYDRLVVRELRWDRRTVLRQRELRRSVPVVSGYRSSGRASCELLPTHTVYRCVVLASAANGMPGMGCRANGTHCATPTLFPVMRTTTALAVGISGETCCAGAMRMPRRNPHAPTPVAYQ